MPSDDAEALRERFPAEPARPQSWLDERNPPHRESAAASTAERRSCLWPAIDVIRRPHLGLGRDLVRGALVAAGST